jgi:signal peptidase I
MDSESASGQAARQPAEVYQAAAREAWQAARANGMVRLTVTSESMRPLVRGGDAVVVQPIEPRALRPGNVIVVQRGGEWITHRLVAIDERGWHTHGDNTRTSDPPAAAAEIVGRVIAIERGDHTIDLQQPRWVDTERRINRVQRWQGRLFAVTRANRLTRGLGALLNWPLHVVVRWLVRSPRGE